MAGQLWKFGSELKRQLAEVAAKAGLEVRVGGVDVHPHLHFAAADAMRKRQLITLYIQEMAKRGCHGFAAFYLNSAQGAAELEQTIAAAGQAFAVMRQAVERDAVEEALECPMQQDAFRRLVR